MQVANQVPHRAVDEGLGRSNDSVQHETSIGDMDMTSIQRPDSSDMFYFPCMNSFVSRCWFNSVIEES